MKILHTADWHLNDRLGRIDRTDDLRKAVERVANHCCEQAVDLLIVAGDLFSELARADALRETIRHWQDVFADFLGRGGTILTCTGNHDNENFCQTLRHAMALAAPTVERIGETVPSGRLYLAAEPTLLKLHDIRGGFDVQFVLMPYPTPTRYLKGELGQKYSDPDEKQKLLITAFDSTIQNLRQHERYTAGVPSVLVAHANVFGAVIGESLFRISPNEDVVVNGQKFAEQFDYVALGHIHKEQFLGHEHIRYSGSIEKLDLGESRDVKSVSLFELGPKGRVGEIGLLPMPTTPMYELNLLDPAVDLPRLKQEYAGAENDLVNLHIRYTAGEHNLEEILRELGTIFPRWYSRDWVETSRAGPTLVIGEADRSKSFGETVRGYLSTELMNHTDAEREELLRLAEELIQGVEQI
jgi:DNA repair protein SbcD/Mre11